MPGGDCNPYLAIAAAVAGMLHGIDPKLDAPARYDGDAYDDPSLEQLPLTLDRSIDQLERDTVLHERMGDELVRHFAIAGRAELAHHDLAVTEWERQRYLELDVTLAVGERALAASRARCPKCWSIIAPGRSVLGVSRPIERPPNRRPAVFAVLLIRRVNRSATFRRSPATVRVAAGNDFRHMSGNDPSSGLRRRSRSFSCAPPPAGPPSRSFGWRRPAAPENDAVRRSARRPADAARRADRSRNDSAERFCEGSAAPCSATERPLPAGSTGDHGGGYRTTGASPGAMRPGAPEVVRSRGPGRGHRRCVGQCQERA